MPSAIQAGRIGDDRRYHDGTGRETWATTPARSRSDVSGFATSAERHRQSSMAPSQAKCCTSIAGSISKA